jgi:hypothetical protein
VSTNPTDPTEPTDSSTDAHARMSVLFRSASPTSLSSLDAGEVIRRSKQRRLPRRIGAGSVLSLAVVGIGVAGVTSAGGFSPMVSSSSDTSVVESAESSDAADLFGSPGETSSPESAGAADSTESFESGSFEGGSITPAPADKVNLCGGTVAETAPSPSGLELTLEFADAAADSALVAGTATLTNTGDAAVTGYSAAAPAITLSRDTIVIWHSNGPTILSATEIDLAPGESMTYPVSFAPVVCSAEDELGGGFRDGLPATSPGQYDVSALLDVTNQHGTELVSGPTTTVTLR